jgi:hypothetical protein
LEEALTQRDARIEVLTRRVAELEPLLRVEFAEVVEAAVAGRASQGTAAVAASALGSAPG